MSTFAFAVKSNLKAPVYLAHHLYVCRIFLELHDFIEGKLTD